MKVSYSLDKYETKEFIGSGTFGSVYKCENKENGKVFALKKVKQFDPNEGFPITTIREMRTLSMFNHPNIIRIEEIVSDKENGDVYLVLEYCKYTLNDFLYGRMSSKCDIKKCARWIFKQIVDAIAEMHKSNIMHRDIKPANILINKEGVIKVGDFGSSRTTQGRTFSSSVAALPYRAPECFHGKYNQKMDVWAAGCVLYEMLTRKLLFAPKDNDMEMIKEISATCSIDEREIVEGNITSLGNIEKLECDECKDCKELLQRMLCTSYDKRIDIFDVQKHPYCSDAVQVPLL